MEAKKKSSIISTVIYLILIALVVLFFFYLNGGFAKDDSYLTLVDKMASVYKTGNGSTYFSIITDGTKEKLSQMYEDYESVISQTLSEQTYDYMVQYGDDLNVTYTINSDKLYSKDELNSLKSSSSEYSNIKKARILNVSFLLKGSRGEATIDQSIICIKEKESWYLIG